MKINRIGFKLSAETFGPDTTPTDVVEIYIDGKKLSDLISCSLPLWPSEIYSSLMRVFFLKDESVNIGVCGCGCVGCGDTEVHIDETSKFVIWYDFIHDLKHTKPDVVFIFEREQYYTEVDKILQWNECQRLVCYIGNVFTVWSDNMRLNHLADYISCSCVMWSDFLSMKYTGKDEVLNALRQNYVVGAYEEKSIKNYFYRVNGYRGEMEEKDYSKWYLEVCSHKNPNEIVMYVVYKTNVDGEIDEILLSRNQSWFSPVYWSQEYPIEFL